MMTCYGYNIAFDSSIDNDKNTILIVEDDLLTLKNLDYKLEFENNQNRQIEFLSNFSFEEKKDSQSYYFHILELFIFSWNLKENKITYKILNKNNSNLLEYWVLHTVLPFFFSVKNTYYFLHAGAVEILDQPVLFIADSYGGKSTLTDFFIKKSHTMISDDKVATFEKDNMIYSVSSYPYHRPYRNVEDLGIMIDNFSREIKPINTIFNLVKSEPNSEVKIEKTIGMEKFKVLRYATDIELPLNKEKRFNFLAKIANEIDIYNITIPWDLNRLEEVYIHILEFIKRKNFD